MLSVVGSAVPASSAGAPAELVTPGHSTSRLNATASFVTWGGNTVGWSRGMIHLHVVLKWNGAEQVRRDHDCAGSTSCSADSLTRDWSCPGTWRVETWATGPGGKSNVDVKETIVPGTIDTATSRAICAKRID
ncbi:hypothetical protein [Streptomyces sp. NPDC058486]|uniref:hypothetical protein n=1 Tax=unclassified Streptomyces TaxID=2593676 RepID=UPI003665DCB0